MCSPRHEYLSSVLNALSFHLTDAYQCECHSIETIIADPAPDSLQQAIEIQASVAPNWKAQLIGDMTGDNVVLYSTSVDISRKWTFSRTFVPKFTTLESTILADIARHLQLRERN